MQDRETALKEIRAAIFTHKYYPEELMAKITSLFVLPVEAKTDTNLLQNNVLASPLSAPPQAEHEAAHVTALRQMVGIAGEFRRTLLTVRECLDALTPGHRTGYDWNADPLYMTRYVGDALKAIDAGLQSLSRIGAAPAPQEPTGASPQADVTCEHGTAMDVHCCNCHSGFIFDCDHECPAPELTWREAIEQALGVESDPENHTTSWAFDVVRASREIGNAPTPASPQAETSAKRPETGPMQFGSDWPGVFVRGDNAGGIVATLMSVVGIVEKVQPTAAVQVRGIMRLFDSSDARKNPEVQRAVLLPAPVSPVEPTPPAESSTTEGDRALIAAVTSILEHARCAAPEWCGPPEPERCVVCQIKAVISPKGEER